MKKSTQTSRQVIQHVLSARTVSEMAVDSRSQDSLDAASTNPQGLFHSEDFRQLRLLLSEKQSSRQRLGAFFSTEDVIIVPGFMGSRLTDVAGGNGLIWIDPGLILNGDQLGALRLAGFSGQAGTERDATAAVRIDAPGALPLVYDLLSLNLEIRRYDVSVFGFDWRKNLEESASRLAGMIRARIGRTTHPLHLIAHSQGSLVARRALQLLGPDLARQLVSHLVLLGPASCGTFSAAFAIAGSHETIDTIRDWGVKLPDHFEQVLQTFTGLYQLVPWKNAIEGVDTDQFGKSGFWKTGVDKDRLKFGFRWAESIDSKFFNDRTAIILGDSQTVSDVKWEAGRLVSAATTGAGDGTVPHVLSRLDGVRTYLASQTTHSRLPMSGAVRSAILAILSNETPDLVPSFGLQADPQEFQILREPTTPAAPPKAKPVASVSKNEIGAYRPPSQLGVTRPTLSPPSSRKLRVYSFDPLLAQRLETLKISTLSIDVPWESPAQLAEGPVGEYIEVIDYDPASNCFYHPVDLSAPEILAQGGLTPSESNPQFHQQMVYAVAMVTIQAFEQALGRVALWSPRFDQSNGNLESKYVPRLRIYPHAIRQANAYYDPERHALLFGYFPSKDQPGGDTLPGGVVFTCLSFDIIAHETTHALLHGLHRHLLIDSNPDMLAFHEAFSDIVALLQHFSHIDVLREQIAKSRGNIEQQVLLGQLAHQFGAAMGKHRGALRKYLGTQLDDGTFEPMKPDPAAYASTSEPHDRGAILVAAIFGAFTNIYHSRTRDLYRIASNGTGVLPDGEIHPDLVNRLAQEATRSASHALRMCIRALDYVTPIDLTFGEYLRALITADYDLVRDDDRGYRVAVVDAFRRWGIYPSDLNTLDVNALLWEAPERNAFDGLQKILEGIPHRNWRLSVSRRQVFEDSNENRFKFRKWLYAQAKHLQDYGDSLGIKVFGPGFHSIPRNKNGLPVFDVHSVRPCCRIGPDGQQRVDLVAVIIQRRAGYFDPEVQKRIDAGPPQQSENKHWAFFEDQAKDLDRPLADRPDFWFRGGATLIIDPDSGEVRYLIRKRVTNDARLAQQREYEQMGGFQSAAATYFDSDEGCPFAMLHESEIESS